MDSQPNSYDSLTRVYNARSFQETLKRETEQAELDLQPLTLLMIDVDRLKAVNDRHCRLIAKRQPRGRFMTTNHKEIAWTQFGAAVDMLERAMAACPDELWSRPAPEMGFWYLAYHTLFLMDYDFSVAAEPFHSAKFDIHEYELREQAPPYENPYPRADLMTYLQHSRDRCRGMIGSLADDDRILRGCQRLEAGVFELVLYHIRHVQHHAAQLNLLLRQNIHSAPRWVRRTNEPLQDSVA